MRDDRGFTLLEVLVALAILAVAITTLLQLSAQSLRLLGLSGEHQGAVLLADRVIRETEPRAEAVDSGQEGAYEWERRVALVELPAEQSPATGAAPRLFSVSVSVRWGTRALEVATLRASLDSQGTRTP